MKKKLAVVTLVIFALIFNLMVLEVYARECGKMKGHQMKGHSWNLEEKFSHKAGFILKNKEELGLSDKQVKKIKDLKIKTKKNLIEKKAEIDLLALDIKGEMWKEKFDVKAINKLIDKKYGLKAEKAKSLVNAYTALKGTLTKKQKEKMKGLMKKCKKGTKHGKMMKGKIGQKMMKDKM